MRVATDLSDTAAISRSITWSVRDRHDAPHHQLAQIFRAAGHQVDIVAWADHPRRWRELKIAPVAKDGAPLRAEPTRVHVPSPSALLRLAKAPGIVVTRELNLQTLVAGSLRRSSRLVCLIESDPAFGGASPTAAWKRPLRSLIARRVDCFLANTEGAAAWLQTQMGVDGDRVITGWWLAGLDQSVTEAGSSIEAQILRNQTAGRPLRVVAVGKLIGRKGFDLLAEAAATLRTEGIDVDLRIAGQGPEEARLRQIDPSALFLGHLPQQALRELFAESDVLVLPSFEELMGRAAVEALSCGVPVIASAASGVAQALVKPWAAGLVVHSESVDALATALRDLHEDRQLLAQVTEGAKKLAPTLSPDRCADTIRLAIGRVEGACG